MIKRALVTGVTGQDGYYLTKHLLEAGYEVIGIKRRTSGEPPIRLNEFVNSKFKIVEGDVTDSHSINSLVSEYMPYHIYNLAAMSHVHTSFNQPSYTFKCNTHGVLNILEAIRNISPETKFYQASTSEMFGKNYSTRINLAKYQDEETPMMPQSPYAISKLASHELVRLYRDSYNIFACCGILYNHESPHRGENFLTRKVTKWVGNFYKWLEAQKEDEEGGFNLDFSVTEDYVSVVRLNKSDKPQPHKDSWMYGCKFPKLRLGNLDACRDWGHAEDHTRAMVMMMNQGHADDYVVATGKTHSVGDFVKAAFKKIGINDWENYIVIDPEFYRPAEVDYLLGDATKAKDVLGWTAKITLDELVNEMVEYDKI